jgi:hypothetical protein
MITIARRSLCATVLSTMLPLLVGAQTRGAVLTGRVLTDTSHLPLANAEVSLPELAINGLTNDKGEFRIAGISAGKHQVLVRHLGYALLDAQLDFAENETVESTVYLSRVTVLDTVMVDARARRSDPLLAEFEENRMRGAGHYVTRAQLEKQEGRQLGSIMSQTPGLAVLNGSGGQAWLTARHGPSTQCGARDTLCLRRERLYYIPLKYEALQGVRRTCYARVYVDRMLMNPGQPADPFDLNSIAPMEIEAIEWYANLSEAPSKYSGRSSVCGIMVIHTRRG